MRFVFLFFFIFCTKILASYNSFEDAIEGTRTARGFLARALIITETSECSGIFLTPRHVLTCMHSVAGLVAKGEGKMLVAYGVTSLPSLNRFPTVDALLRANNILCSRVQSITPPQNTFFLSPEELEANKAALSKLYTCPHRGEDTRVIGDDIALLTLAENVAPLVIKFPRLCPPDDLEDGQSIETRVVASCGNLSANNPFYLDPMYSRNVPHAYGVPFEYHEGFHELAFQYTPSDLKTLKRINGMPVARPIDGNSGSPVLMTSGEDLILIGVISRTATRNNIITAERVTAEIATALPYHSSWIQAAIHGQYPRLFFPFFLNGYDLSKFSNPPTKSPTPDEPHNKALALTNQKNGIRSYNFGRDTKDTITSQVYAIAPQLYAILDDLKTRSVVTQWPRESITSPRPVTIFTGSWLLPHKGYGSSPNIIAPLITFEDVWIKGTPQFKISKHPKYPSYVNSVIFERLPGAQGIFISGSIDFSTPVPQFDGTFYVHGANVIFEWRR